MNFTVHNWLRLSGLRSRAEPRPSGSGRSTPLPDGRGSANAVSPTCAGVIALVAALVVASGRPALAIDPDVAAAEQQRVAVVGQVSPSVVAIFSPGGAGGGSGVLITADGYALTNFHVTHGAGNFMKCGLADGVLYDAVIVGIDPTGDVAMIKLFGRDDFPAARLGDSDALQVGDWAFAMGNPFLLATDFSPTVTFGIVSGIHRYQYPAGSFLEYADCIQTDSSINPGNSGGPLFNSAGELVGINGRGSFEKRGRVNSGAGYAISINQIKNFMDSLRGGLVVDHATLGATVATRDDGSVVVTGILEQSEVFRRGLRTDDEIVSVAGRTIRSVNQFKNVLGIYPKGWKLPLVYRRKGRKQEISVRLRGLHRQSELTLNQKQPGPPRPQQPPEQPRDRPGGQPRPQQPRMPQQQPQPHKPPAELAKLYVEKPGFTNYHFNVVERDRTLKGLVPFGDFSKETGTWKLAAIMAADESPCEFTLGDALSGLVVAGGKKTFVQELNPDARLEDEPPGSGGFLLAMHHFRRLLIQGPAGFSEFYYLGSEPLDGTGETVDVLFCERYGARSHWYFSRATGLLAGFDTFRDEEVDPCEVRLAGHVELAGRRLPELWTIRYGDAEFARFKFTSATFPPPKPDTKPEVKAESN
ncbi:MAG: trypsin-like peptidase domain-containing protein [Planctomycetia bacterium]|nr:trypsin-like peptidase domain-containing protein [Planctomycetia bacterium]